MNKNVSQRKQRRPARRLAMQALYQWHYNHTESDELITVMLEEQDDIQLDQSYFEILVDGVIKDISAIDVALQPSLDRQLVELNPVELAILRVAAFEMLHRIDIPYRVVINEWVELAKEFGSEQGYKYINAVLDKLAHTHRSSEIKS